MFKSSKEFEKMMYNILVQIHNNPDINDLLSKFEGPNFDAALEECINNQLLSGVTLQRSADNVGMLSIIDPKISIKGLEFIEKFKE